MTSPWTRPSTDPTARALALDEFQRVLDEATYKALLEHVDQREIIASLLCQAILLGPALHPDRAKAFAEATLETAKFGVARLTDDASRMATECQAFISRLLEVGR